MTDSRLRVAGLALCLLGAALAGYLTWVHYADAQTVCVGGGGSCERVQTSDYAEVAGVPVALLGLVGYLTLLGAFAAGRDGAVAAAAFVGIVGAGFSAYLTYIEVFTLEAICQWCVASAVMMTAIALIACARFLRQPGT